MALIRSGRRELSPWRDVFDLQDDMSRFFELGLAKWPTPVSSWMPELDVYEEKDHVVVKAEVPGMDEKDIEISLEKNLLTIKGEKKQESETKEGGYYHYERRFGKFQRSVELPSEIDANAIKATYKNGVLHITLPKKEEVKPKQIKIDIQK